MFNAHVIEFVARAHLAAVGAVFYENLGWKEEAAKIAEIDAAHNFKHGWYFDAMAGRVFQNDGGRGIVWCDQPYMD